MGSKSPQETVSIKSEDLEVSVTYCRPFKRERLIFGEESNNALVPFGQYWRLGANDATEITFSKDVIFADKKVPAGTYRMYAVPNADIWEVSLNSELGKFGYFEPDYSLDIAKVNMPVENKSDITDQFTIDLHEKTNAVKMSFIWDQTQVNIPIISN